MTKKFKTRIRERKDGKWACYRGTSVVLLIDNAADAADWLFKAQHPRYDYGKQINPETGEAAPQDQMWCQNTIGGGKWYLESVYTPYTCSPCSETYWSS